VTTTSPTRVSDPVLLIPMPFCPPGCRIRESATAGGAASTVHHDGARPKRFSPAQRQVTKFGDARTPCSAGSAGSRHDPLQEVDPRS
jgi:hypothetical protein